MPAKKISIIIPCFNEEKNLSKMLKQTNEVLSREFQNSYEIIVVNDGSSDRSFEKIKRLQKNNTHLKCISYKKNQGRGFAIKKGLKEMSGNVIGVIDANMEIPPQLLTTYYKKLKKEKCDIILGSQWHNKSITEYSFKKQFLLQLSNKIIEILFQLKDIDTQIGLKMFRKEVAKKAALKAKSKRFTFDIEFLVLAKNKGLNIISAPIYIKNSKSNPAVSKINIIQRFLKTMQLHHQMNPHIQAQSGSLSVLRSFLLMFFLPMEFVFETLVEA